MPGDIFLITPSFNFARQETSFQLTVDSLPLAAKDVDDGGAVPLHRLLELRRREGAQHRLHLGSAATLGGRAGLEGGACKKKGE